MSYKVKNIEEVVKCWSKGITARSGNLRSDGQSLFSYSKEIGKTIEGKKVVCDYRAHNWHNWTRTTSKHVSLGMKYGDFKTEDIVGFEHMPKTIFSTSFYSAVKLGGE